MPEHWSLTSIRTRKKHRTPLHIHDQLHLIGDQIIKDIEIPLGCYGPADMEKF